MIILKALILTDHSRHSSENSLYALASELTRHSAIMQVDIASRKTDSNFDFFNATVGADLWVTTIDETFAFHIDDHPLDKVDAKADVELYDFIWLRMPPPLSESLLYFLDQVFKGKVIINNPLAIYETGSKAFLLNFKELCPPMRLCHSFEDIALFNKEHPIVLKPLREYGGKGIVKIEGSSVMEGGEATTLEAFADQYQQNPIDYLAVKYLKNVNQGDRRIIIVDGELLGASLRLPAADSWLCNVSMGGTSHQTAISPEEIEIVKTIDPILSAKGIVMYGVDTLMGDDGKRVLSEINTTSIGGLPQIARLNGQPLVEKGINTIVSYVLKRMQ